MDAKEVENIGSAGSDNQHEIDFLNDVELNITLEFGRAQFTIQDLLSWKKGTVIQLDKTEGEALEILSNGNPVAKGEAVIVNEKYGVRVTQILNPQDFDLEEL